MKSEGTISNRLEELLKKYNAENIIEIFDDQQLCMKEHQQRVAQMASVVALAMGLSETDEEAVFIAASIHDIGFVDTSFNINVGKVNFKGLYEKLETHSEIGANMLRDIEFPAPISDIVLQHHEKLDGSGFPNGIKNVMIEAQILAVVDTIDGVLSIHSENEEQAIKHATDMIDDMRNGLLDPEIIDVAIDQLSKRNMVF